MYSKVKIGYAGRLDPMAEGVLLLLIGDENKKKKEYEALPKEYEFVVLFGVSTDSYDILGIVDREKPIDLFSNGTVNAALQSCMGVQQQPYPPFSSMQVLGKPLFYWARNNKLNDIVIPTKSVEIYASRLHRVYTIPKETLQKTIQKRLRHINGDFRQETIREQWELFFSQTQKKEFFLADITIACSSGTYIRSLARLLGEKLQTKALAFSIKRTKVGTLTKRDAIVLEAA